GGLGGWAGRYLRSPEVDQRLSNEFDCACAGALALPLSDCVVGASAICCGLLSAATCCGFGFAACATAVCFGLGLGRGAAATCVSVCVGCARCGLEAWEAEAGHRPRALPPPVPAPARDVAPASLIGEAAAARIGVDPLSSVGSRGGLTLLPISPGWAPATLVWLYLSHGFLCRRRARNTECM